jgi:hypothetical protein
VLEKSCLIRKTGLAAEKIINGVALYGSFWQTYVDNNSRPFGTMGYFDPGFAQPTINNIFFCISVRISCDPKSTQL